MGEGQNKRQIGKGMKPRGNQRFKPQREAKEMTVQSTTEGHEAGVKEPVLEAQDLNKTPSTLEPENGGNSLQILEKSEPIVARNEDLAAALEESGYEDDRAKSIGLLSQAEPSLDDIESAIASGIKPDTYSDLDTAMAVGTGSVKELKRPTIAELEELLNRYGSEGVLLEPNGTVKLAIGPQPDGSEKFIITVAEGYTDAVRQWAESVGVPVERWLSDRLYEYISTYGEPARAR